MKGYYFKIRVHNYLIKCYYFEVLINIERMTGCYLNAIVHIALTKFITSWLNSPTIAFHVKLWSYLKLCYLKVIVHINHVKCEVIVNIALIKCYYFEG